MAVQAHKIVAGIGPLRPLVRIGTAAGQLLSIPLEQLWQKSYGKVPASDGPSGASGIPTKATPPVSWQLQRSLAGAHAPAWLF